MRTLWYLRHHYMVRLIDLGARHARARHHPGPPRGQPRSRHGLGVNTLMLDGDITLHGNPYALLKAPPLHHSSQIPTLLRTSGRGADEQHRAAVALDLVALGEEVQTTNSPTSQRWHTDHAPLLKAPPLARHQLLYSLDHRNFCDEVNIGFMYCQGCARRGRAQWVVNETLRRERSFCSPDANAVYGDGGTFFAATDAAGVCISPPHRHRPREEEASRARLLTPGGASLHRSPPRRTGPGCGRRRRTRRSCRTSSRRPAAARTCTASSSRTTTRCSTRRQ